MGTSDHIVRAAEHAGTDAEPDNRRPASGLKPISRLSSDERHARIQPQTQALVTIEYGSVFVRDFLVRDFKFCVSKLAVARGGKLLAVEEAFRDAEEGFSKTIFWLDQKPALEIPILPDSLEVEVKHPLAGRLIRLLNLYDIVFSHSLFALGAKGISSSERENVIESSARRITLIHSLCIPDDDQFAVDGSRRSAAQRQ